MIVYGSSMSPFVRKVLVFAAEKGIEVENQVIRPGQEDSDFFSASPFRKIPALRDGDFKICDSSAIVAYLEALHPEPNLIPLEPRSRARTIWYDEFMDTILFDCGRKIFFNRFSSGRDNQLGRAVQPQIDGKKKSRDSRDNKGVQNPEEQKRHPHLPHFCFLADVSGSRGRSGEVGMFTVFVQSLAP